MKWKKKSLQWDLLVISVVFLGASDADLVPLESTKWEANKVLTKVVFPSPLWPK